MCLKLRALGTENKKYCKYVEYFEIMKDFHAQIMVAPKNLQKYLDSKTILRSPVYRGINLFL